MSFDLAASPLISAIGYCSNGEAFAASSSPKPRSRASNFIVIDVCYTLFRPLRLIESFQCSNTSDNGMLK